MFLCAFLIIKTIRGANLEVSVLSADPTLQLQNKANAPAINDFMNAHFFGNRLKRKDATKSVSSKRAPALLFARNRR